MMRRSREIQVVDVRAFDAALAQAKPGDVLVLREGEWRDAMLRFRGKGMPKKPLTLRAQAPGKTVFTGKSQLRVEGEFLVIEGLWFQNPDPSVGDPIVFSSATQHCRLTRCAITREPEFGPRESQDSHWVALGGEAHRMDHCSFQGKRNKGTTVIVALGAGKHRLDHNYFGPREPLEENGGETLRVGDSKTSQQLAACVIEQNLFERCNGELECISNKSCGNLYRENTFLSVSGTLTLRHGNGCTVEKNVFLGKGAAGTGGIRIIGEDHVVRGNYLEGLTGSEARSGLTLAQGIPDSPLNGYFQVKRARVEDNTLVDCEHPLLIGMASKTNTTLPPLDCLLARNVIVSPQALVVVEARCAFASFRWLGNTFWGKTLGIAPTDGILWKQTPPDPLIPIARSAVGCGFLLKSTKNNG